MLIGSEIASSADISSFSTMWMYYLPKYLEKNNVDVGFFPRYVPSQEHMVWAKSLVDAAKNYDAIIAPGVRYFSTLPLDVCKWLRENFSGVVSHIYDASMLDSQHVDLTLTIMNSNENYIDNFERFKRHVKHNSYIGWAADHEKYVPSKSKKLRVFIDHPTFDFSRPDYTLNVMMNLKHIPVEFEARTLTNEGLITVDVDNISVQPFNRYAVSADDFANELNEAHIFICTHPETLGLTVIEAAMAGCFVLIPPNAIPNDRIKHVNHAVYNGKIDWGMVMRNLDSMANRKRALKHTWDMVAKRMIVAISDFDKN